MGKNLQRIYWLDIMRGIAMFCVMLSHVSLCPLLYKTIFGPFFLSAFFFVSGYLYNKKENFKEYFYHKNRTLLVPFFVFGFINIVLRQFLTFHESPNFLLQIKNFLFQIQGKGGELWFIACLYVASLVFYLINEKIKEKDWKYLIFITFLGILTIVYAKVVSIALPWHIQIVGIAIFFMGLGYYYKLYLEEKVKKYENIKTLAVISIIYILLLVFDYVIFKATFIAINRYNTSIIMFFLLSIISLWIIIIISKYIQNFKFLNFIGKNTFIYFAFHGKVESILMKLLNIIVDINILNKFVFSILFIIIEAIILIIPSYIINKYMPWILGKKKAVKE